MPPAASRPARGRSGAGRGRRGGSLRKNWDAVLEAVKQERRVAWMLLSNASVLSVEDGILTLRFPRDGDLKGFSVSGHDAVLKRVLSADFGLNVTVKGVVGGDAARGAAQALDRRILGRPRPGRPGQPVPGPRRRPATRRPAGSRPTSRRMTCRPTSRRMSIPAPGCRRPNSPGWI